MDEKLKKVLQGLLDDHADSVIDQCQDVVGRAYFSSREYAPTLNSVLEELEILKRSRK